MWEVLAWFEAKGSGSKMHIFCFFFDVWLTKLWFGTDVHKIWYLVSRVFFIYFIFPFSTAVSCHPAAGWLVVKQMRAGVFLCSNSASTVARVPYDMVS